MVVLLLLVSVGVTSAQAAVDPSIVENRTVALSDSQSITLTEKEQAAVNAIFWIGSAGNGAKTIEAVAGRARHRREQDQRVAKAARVAAGCLRRAWGRRGAHGEQG
jgi:hypothetical protein